MTYHLESDVQPFSGHIMDIEYDEDQDMFWKHQVEAFKSKLDSIFAAISDTSEVEEVLQKLVDAEHKRLDYREPVSLHFPCPCQHGILISGLSKA